MKRFIYLLLIIVIMLTGCVRTPDNEDDAQPVYLPNNNVYEISVYTDGMASPFQAQSYEDKHIVSLVYESLYVIDNDYSLKPVLADSYYLSDNVLTLTLKSGMKFSDGTPFDAEALIDALSRVEGARYAPLIDAIVQTNIVSSDCVQLTLSAVPDNIMPTLTFPIVNAAGRGIGPYVFEDSTTLIPNDWYPDNPATKAAIHLVSGDKVALFNNKEISFLYNDGSISQGDLDKSLTVLSVSTNELTFLGLNRQRRIFSRAEYRNALSCLTDRTYLSSFSPQGNGYVSFSVINPAWYKYDHSAVTTKYSAAEATEILEGVLKNASVRIVVNNENINRVMIARSIAETLESLGAKATVASIPWDDYIAAINSGNYDIYVGETRLPETMSVSALLPEYASYSAAELIAVLDADMPVIPLFFDQHTLISNGVTPDESEPYLSAVGYK